MNSTEERAAVRLLKEGTAHLSCEPPTVAEIEAMLAVVPRNSERRWTSWAVAAAALVVGAVMLTTLDRPGRDGPPTEQVQAPAPDTDAPEKPKPEPEKADPKPVTFTFEEAWRAADHLKRTNRFAEAAASYGKIVTSCRTEDEIAKHAPRAQMQIGECLYRQEKFIESFRAYDAVVTKYSKIAPIIAADGAYYRYRAATALFAAVRNRENEERKKKARADFLEEFPDHPRAIDLGYYIGADRIVSGDILSAAGQAEDARRLWEDAILTFRKVKCASNLYEKARARTGETLYKLGRTDEALVVFRKILTEDAWKTSDPQRLANQRAARVLAVLWSARCHRRREEWGKVLDVLDGFETKYGKAERDGRLYVAPVKLERVRALLALGRGEEAVTEAESLRADHGPGGNAAEAAARVGLYLYGHGEWKAAAEWLEYVLEGGRPVTAADYALAGLAAEKLSDLERAEKRLAAAVAEREKELRTRKTVRDQGAVDVHLATWRQDLARVRKALGR